MCGNDCYRMFRSTPSLRVKVSYFDFSLLICSVAAFGPSSAEDANHASFPCLVSQELPQTNLYEIRCQKHVFLLSWLNMRNGLLVLFCKALAS